MKKLLAPTLLAALMIAAPAAAQKPLPAKLPFSPAIRVGDMLYMSGQIGQVPDGMDPHKVRNIAVKLF